VGFAIIDFPLVLDHVEYKDKIKFYEHIHYPNNEAHFHGPLVTSIAMGNNIGVAPGASLYFIADISTDVVKGEHVYNYSYTAQSIRRLIEVNNILPKEDKIRVISISMAISPEQSGYDEYLKAAGEAEREGIFVVSANLFQQEEHFFFHGLYKEAMDDPDDFKSYKPYSWEKWMAMVAKPIYKFDTFYEQEFEKASNKKILLIPMGGITVATATGNNDYEYLPDGGWSSAVPYISGLYALTCQVKPDITPKEFLNAVYETGLARTIEKDGKKYEGRIPNPEELVKYLEKK
jgi:subtilisin family serine protease